MNKIYKKLSSFLFPLSSFQNGQSLIEVLLIVTLVTVVIAGNVSFLARSYSITEFAAGQTAATYLAAEGLEIVKNLIDANCSKGAAFTEDFDDNSEYSVDFLSSKPESPKYNEPLLFDPLESGGTNFYGYYHAGLTSADAQESLYSRIIKIKFLGGVGKDKGKGKGDGQNNKVYAIKADSIVTWTSRQGKFDVNLTGIFYNLCELKKIEAD